MIKMMTVCGRCEHYTADHRCGNMLSKEYGKLQFSNVCWQCPHFDGKMYPWDTERAIPMGARPSTFTHLSDEFVQEGEYEVKRERKSKDGNND